MIDIEGKVLLIESRDHRYTQVFPSFVEVVKTRKNEYLEYSGDPDELQPGDKLIEAVVFL